MRVHFGVFAIGKISAKFFQEHPRLNSALRLYSVKLVSISLGFSKEARAVDPTDIRFRLLRCEL